MKLLVIALIVLFALTLTFTSVQAQTPTITVERLPDNSIILTWDNISRRNFYSLLITENGVSTYLGFTTAQKTHTFSPGPGHYERINNAERIGVIPHSTDDASPVDDGTYGTIPAEIQQPTVTVERLVNNSIKVSWEAIQTDATEDYGIRITEGVTDSDELVAVSSTDSTFTFEPSDDLYERVTDAQRVGVHGTVSGGTY